MSSVPYTFANQTANIPLSQLDTNFANVKNSVDYVIQSAQANITSVGTLTSLSVSGNIIHSGNLLITGSIIDASGQMDIQTTFGNSNIALNLAGAGMLTVNTQVSAVGNVTGGNLKTSGMVVAGSVTATGNITGANLVTVGGVSAGTVTAADASLTGNLVVAGNATVNGTTTFINTQDLNITDKNIIIANGVSTSVLIDGAGIDAGNPTVAYIRYSHASQGWTTANSFTVGTTLSVTGNAILSGISTASTAANTTANTQIATTAFVRNIIPTGVITLWYGSIVSIPAGWYLCDGGNGTPDLRDRFIVGAGSTYAVAATGGSANATLVSHNHTATSVVTDPGHVHPPLSPQTEFGGSPNTGEAPRGDVLQGTSVPTTGSNTTGITVATTISTAGSSATDANLPPYYALAYIMKA